MRDGAKIELTKIGKPKNTVISVMGDGSFGFAVGELETAKRLNLKIIFIVISNSYIQIVYHTPLFLI